jgi:hypothetical protein
MSKYHKQFTQFLLLLKHSFWVETGTAIAAAKPNVAHVVTPEKKGKHAKVP